MDIFQEIRTSKQVIPIENIKDINVIDKDGESLLHCAIAYKNIAVSLMLIDNGINVNHQNKNGHTALHYAVDHNQIEIVQKLLKKSVSINITDKFGNNALWKATFNARGDYNIVKLLVDAGADANSKNKNGLSPLDFAKQIKDARLESILS